MNKVKAFTLIELLVVIAIIALLLSIMVPGLRIAKEYAASAVCLTNQKNLDLGWIMYADDNDTYLVGGSTYASGTRATPYRWVERPLRYDTDNAETTSELADSELSLQTRINGIRAGKLFVYTQDPELYHCPADRTSVKNAEPYAIYRSYSISGLMNGEDFIRRSAGLYSPIAEFRVVGDRTLRVATKMGQITNPGSKYVFIEEDVVTSKTQPQKWNQGGFVLMNSGPNTWWDSPAYFHNDSSTLGFADGHAERIRWQDSRTIQIMKGEPVVNRPEPNEDLLFLIRGYFPMP